MSSEEKKLTIDPWGIGEETEVKPQFATYANNGTLAIELKCMIDLPFPTGTDGNAEDLFIEPYATVTVNLEQSAKLPLNVQYVDENNLPWIGEWLQKNDLARPTGMMARSGWCMYPAYEFNLPEETLKMVEERRMECNPGQTAAVVKDVEMDTLLDLKDDIDRCMTLGELKESWLTMPEKIRDQVTFPERISIDGTAGLTIKEWEVERFTRPVPEGLPAYSYTEARQKFEEARDRLDCDRSIKDTCPTPTGILTRFGEIGFMKVTHYFPSEYSNPFLVEERNGEGRITAEYIAMDNSYSDNMKSGPCLEHMDGGTTTFSVYAADTSSDNCFRDAQCTFSKKGSLIAVSEGDFGPSCGDIRHTQKYNDAVKECRNILKEELNKVIAKTQSQSHKGGISR